MNPKEVEEESFEESIEALDHDEIFDGLEASKKD